MSQQDWPTLQGIEGAVETVRPHMAETPLVKSEMLSAALAADVWLKNETVTPIASFKIRGALAAVVQAKSGGAAAVVTSSTGNHGQGVAYAARALGMQAFIFLPDPANPVKAAMIEAFGGVLYEVGDTFDLCKAAAQRFADTNGHVFVDDGEDRAVMEGAGTVAWEVAQALADIDALIVPMGGGNLSAGCATAMKVLQPQARIISVQAKGSPAMTESFHAREPVQRPIDTIADGLVTGVPPVLALAVLWERLDDAWLTDDESLLAGVHTLAEAGHVLVEPAGSAALVGAWQHRDELAGKRIVLILTGANISAALLRRALSLSPLW
ncbi:MAG: pyridoxal-phosphate dependent enzyme [Gammaproteobacteria bacterium]|nr:pyridoxal-phosphate dependent enzyme [Gammaproteobacteria bacterium]